MNWLLIFIFLLLKILKVYSSISTPNQEDCNTDEISTCLRPVAALNKEKSTTVTVCQSLLKSLDCLEMRNEACRNNTELNEIFKSFNIYLNERCASNIENNYGETDLSQRCYTNLVTLVTSNSARETVCKGISSAFTCAQYKTESCSIDSKLPDKEALLTDFNDTAHICRAGIQKVDHSLLPLIQEHCARDEIQTCLQPLSVLSKENTTPVVACQSLQKSAKCLEIILKACENNTELDEGLQSLQTYLKERCSIIKENNEDGKVDDGKQTCTSDLVSVVTGNSSRESICREINSVSNCAHNKTQNCEKYTNLSDRKLIFTDFEETTYICPEILKCPLETVSQCAKEFWNNYYSTEGFSQVSPSWCKTWKHAIECFDAKIMKSGYNNEECGLQHKKAVEEAGRYYCEDTEILKCPLETITQCAKEFWNTYYLTEDFSQISPSWCKSWKNAIECLDTTIKKSDYNNEECGLQHKKAVEEAGRDYCEDTDCSNKARECLKPLMIPPNRSYGSRNRCNLLKLVRSCVLTKIADCKQAGKYIIPLQFELDKITLEMERCGLLPYSQYADLPKCGGAIYCLKDWVRHHDISCPSTGCKIVRKSIACMVDAEIECEQAEIKQQYGYYATQKPNFCS